MSQTSVLIAGADKGIGRVLAEAILSRPGHVVVAAVRDVAATIIQDTKPAKGTKLVFVQMENASRTDPFQAVEELKKQGITALNIVIADARVNPLNAMHEAKDIDVSQHLDILDINTSSFVTLFKAVCLLLKATADSKGDVAAKLVVISSWTGRIQDMEPSIPAKTGSYGLSKLGLNYLVRRTQFENPWLTAWMIDPGFAQSHKSNATAILLGLPQAPLPLSQNASDLLARIDGATRNTTCGRFFNDDGTVLRSKLYLVWRWPVMRVITHAACV